ncbi:MAG TPA: hypothetical protein VMA30_01045 [Xanthobacteraceae bacterium]|nr:hypothetical protein [Xanthobacteraceae bacterium]
MTFTVAVCSGTPGDAVLCDAELCEAKLCDDVVCDVELCEAGCRDVMSCDDTSCAQPLWMSDALHIKAIIRPVLMRRAATRMLQPSTQAGAVFPLK